MGARRPGPPHHEPDPSLGSPAGLSPHPGRAAQFCCSQAGRRLSPDHLCLYGGSRQSPHCQNWAVESCSRLAGDAAENFEGRRGHSRKDEQCHRKGEEGIKVGAGMQGEGIREDTFGFSGSSVYNFGNSRGNAGTLGASGQRNLHLRGMVYFTFSHNLNYPGRIFLMKSN